MGYRELLSKIKKGVVGIAYGHPAKAGLIGTTKERPEERFWIVGTGFLVDAEEGVVVTAAHVVMSWIEQRKAEREGGPKAADLLYLILGAPRVEADGIVTRFRTVYANLRLAAPDED